MKYSKECERKREERVKGEKMMWPLAPRGRGDVAENRGRFGLGSNLHGFVSGCRDVWFRSFGLKIGRSRKFRVENRTIPLKKSPHKTD